MPFQKRADAKITYTTELLLPHLDRLRKDSEARDVSMASLFEQAIQLYCYGSEITLIQFPKEHVLNQRKHRKKIGVKRHTLSLRPAEIMSIENIAKKQRRPPKHLIEDALSHLFGENKSNDDHTLQTESQQRGGVKGILSEVKNRIQTTPRHR